jgi:hypothetical protein
MQGARALTVWAVHTALLGGQFPAAAGDCGVQRPATTASDCTVSPRREQFMVPVPRCSGCSGRDHPQCHRAYTGMSYGFSQRRRLISVTAVCPCRCGGQTHSWSQQEHESARNDAFRRSATIPCYSKGPCPGAVVTSSSDVCQRPVLSVLFVLAGQPVDQYPKGRQFLNDEDYMGILRDLLNLSNILDDMEQTGIVSYSNRTQYYALYRQETLQRMSVFKAVSAWEPRGCELKPAHRPCTCVGMDWRRHGYHTRSLLLDTRPQQTVPDAHCQG